MVTSSAVVGSSAISTSGSPLMAMAPTTRCFMPPLIWCGILADALLGRGDLDAAQRRHRLLHDLGKRGALAAALDRLAQLVADREHRD